LGLYAGYTNTVEIKVIDSKLDTFKSTANIITTPLPTGIPTDIHVDVADRKNMESGMNLVSNLSGLAAPPLMPYMVDSYGDVRWYLDYRTSDELNGLSYDCGINRLQNGNYRFSSISHKKIYEVDVFGKIINTWSLGDYIFHHDVYEKPNGNFLVTVTMPHSTNSNGSPTVQDYVIEIDRTSGAIINTWDLKQSLDEYRVALNVDLKDWIHENGVIYDPSDNTIILSGRVQGVVKLTYDNKVKWILGPHNDWGKNGRGEDLNQYLLTPLDAAGKPITDSLVLTGWADAPDFEWNWYQHCPQFMPNGDITMFDNGETRNYNPAEVHFSRAVEYRINEANMTVQQIWTYGQERGLETFARIVSSVYYLPQKRHILFAPGYQVINATGKGGKIVEVDYDTKKVVFQMSISVPSSFSHHRVQRMELYPSAKPYN
jgi:arylsulfate sulfotransferase